MNSATPHLRKGRKTRTFRALLAASSAALFATTACSSSGEPPPTATNPVVPVVSDTGMSATTRRTLEYFMGALQFRSFKTRSIDWPKLNAEVFEIAKNVKDLEQLNPAILHALTVIDDRHSRFISLRGTVVRYRPVDCNPIPFALPAIPSRIGYVHMRGAAGTQPEATDYANAVQDSLHSQDADSLVGWIIDLRNNTGGSMWPMLAGIGPLLGNVNLGYFTYPDGETQRWYLKDGVPFLNGAEQQKATRIYALRNPNARVAVITNKATASSGEAVRIAFNGRPNTRFFGTETCGQSSVISFYRTFDNAELYLAIAVMADRTGKLFGSVLLPDEAVTADEEVMQRAANWLMQK